MVKFGARLVEKSHQKQVSTGIRATIVPKLAERLFSRCCRHLAAALMRLRACHCGAGLLHQTGPEHGQLVGDLSVIVMSVVKSGVRPCG